MEIKTRFNPGQEVYYVLGDKPSVHGPIKIDYIKVYAGKEDCETYYCFVGNIIEYVSVPESSIFLTKEEAEKGRNAVNNRDK